MLNYNSLWPTCFPIFFPFGFYDKFIVFHRFGRVKGKDTGLSGVVSFKDFNIRSFSCAH